jgi:hypothetical protein
MKVAAEVKVQTSRLREIALDDSDGLRSAEPLDQDLACNHQGGNRSDDHREAPLSNRLHFIGSIPRNFRS